MSEARLIKLALPCIGGVLELAGVVLMSSRYLRFDLGYAIFGLIASLWRGKRANKMAKMENLSTEDVVATLQGLALIGLGFLFNTASNILAAID